MKIVGFALSIRRDVIDRRWAKVTMARHWTDTSTRGSHRRVVAETWFDCSGMTERETVAAALQEIRLAYLDELG